MGEDTRYGFQMVIVFSEPGDKTLEKVAVLELELQHFGGVGLFDTVKRNYSHSGMVTPHGSLRFTPYTTEIYPLRPYSEVCTPT